MIDVIKEIKKDEFLEYFDSLFNSNYRVFEFNFLSKNKVDENLKIIKERESNKEVNQVYYNREDLRKNL